MVDREGEGCYSALLVDALSDVDDGAVLGVLGNGVQSSVDGGEVIFPGLGDCDLFALALRLWKLDEHSDAAALLGPIRVAV